MVERPEPGRDQRTDIQRLTMGWWRRNRWGLVAIVPVVLALLALSGEDLYNGWYVWEPREPIAANADGTFSLNGTDVRLVEFGPAKNLQTYDGEPFQPPANVVIWRARIEFIVRQPKPLETEDPLPSASGPQGTPTPVVTLPPETQIGGCDVSVVDKDDRVFEDNPDDILNQVRDVFVDGADNALTYGCLAGYDDDPLHYVGVFYFALPRSATPAAIRLSAGSLPHYIRLIPSGRIGTMSAGTPGDTVYGGGK